MWCLEGFKLRTSLKPCPVLTFFLIPAQHWYLPYIYMYVCMYINLTHKTETGTANRWGTTNSNHMDQLLWLANQKHWVAVKSYLLHSFVQECSNCAFYQPRQIVQVCRAKPTFLSQTDMFWLFFIQFYCADRILSTA
jgi:hypothetical protein